MPPLAIYARGQNPPGKLAADRSIAVVNTSSIGAEVKMSELAYSPKVMLLLAMSQGPGKEDAARSFGSTWPNSARDGDDIQTFTGTRTSLKSRMQFDNHHAT